MAQITHRLGSANRVSFEPLTIDGTPAPIAGMQMELRISAAGQCIVLPGVPTGAAFVVAPAAAGLPAGRYVASEYYLIAGEPILAGDHLLVVEEGC